MKAQVQERIVVLAAETDSAGSATDLGQVKSRKEAVAQVDDHLGRVILDLLFNFLENLFAVAAFQVAVVDGLGALGGYQCVHGFVGQEQGILEECVGHGVGKCGHVFHFPGEDHQGLGISLQGFRKIERSGIVTGFFCKPLEQRFLFAESLEKVLETVCKIR